MRILMINPSSVTPEAPREYILGIPYLVSGLRAEGFCDIQVLNYFNKPWEETEKLTTKMLEDFKPNAVLISCFTINRVAGYKTALLAKEFNPSIKVVMGGFHPTFMYKQILSHYPVDAVCIGEGEETVVELLNAYKNNASVDGIKGIAYKKDGVIVETERRPYVKDLDTIPLPAHDIYKNYLLKTRKGYIISSRGCPFGCWFCSTTEFWGKTWRARSPKNVVDEIEMLLRDYGVTYINFMDDEFTLNKKRTIEICKDIINRGMNIDWICSTRVNSINEEMLGWMKRAGCKHIALGVESGSPKILKTIGKKITVEQIIRGFDLLKEYGLSRGVYLMVGNCGEDSESVNETIRLIRRLNLDVDSVAVAEVYPGTQLYDIAKNKGFIDDDYWLRESPPPFYTVEATAERLQWWAFLIVFNSKRLQGPLNLLRFIIWYIYSKRKKIVGYIVRNLNKFFRREKERYSYKEY